MVFFGSACAVAILVVAYLLTMWAYFAVRKRHADYKYLIEVVTVLMTFGVSFLMKLLILLINEHTCFEDGFTAILDAVYFSIGGLAFDGVEMSIAGRSAINCIYSGTALYSGAIFLSVITAKASYDVYSGIRIAFLRFSPKMRKGLVDIYLFNSVSEDTLLLAQSIDAQYQNTKGSKKDGKSHVVIFTGGLLDSFDRRNPEHCEIMARGYYYWQFSTNGASAQVSLLKRFGLHINNDFTKNKSNLDKLGEIHVFALAKNDNFSGLESENSDFISNEIGALTKEYIGGASKERSIVNFYLLSDDAIDYGYYSTFVKRIVNEAIDDSSVKPCEELREKLCNFYFQLNVLNEAELAGVNLSEKRNEVFKNVSFERGENLFAKDVASNANQAFRAMVLGFGRTGECALSELVTSTAYVDGNGKVGQFYADVYDTSASNCFGAYSTSHPLCRCINMQDSTKCVGEEDIDLSIQERIKSVFSSCGYDFGRIKDEMCLPIIGLHSLSCFSYDFADFLNHKVVADEGFEKCNKSRYNAFIVTLGNDEKNIKMANFLITELKNESVVNVNNGKIQTIYVHIRDLKNFARVLWNKEDEIRHENLKVIIFGCSSEIYSYKCIVDQGEQIAYNAAYNNLVTEQAQEEIIKVLKNPSDEDYEGKFDKLYRYNESFSIEQATQAWLKLDMWRKESTSAAKRFCMNYQTFFNFNNLSGKNLYTLSAIEHERWCRFYIMSGWVYKNYKPEDKAYSQANKGHKCICPMAMLDLDIIAYDTGNVLMAKNKQLLEENK